MDKNPVGGADTFLLGILMRSHLHSNVKIRTD